MVNESTPNISAWRYITNTQLNVKWLNGSILILALVSAIHNGTEVLAAPTRLNTNYKKHTENNNNKIWTILLLMLIELSLHYIIQFACLAIYKTGLYSQLGTANFNL